MKTQTNKWQQFTCLYPSVIQSFQQNQLLHPTKVQTEVFSQYKNYYDFLIASQTGSGKTYAFVAPIVSDLLFLQERYGYIPERLLCLILTPTRQLAQQIQKNILLVTKDTQLKTVCVVGGLSRHKQLRLINQIKPQILVATPGRLNQLLEQQIVNFQCIKYLVIDEADRMMQLGHFVQVDNILNKVFTPKLKQQFEQDFHEINQAMKKKNKKATRDFYMRDEKGKIIPLKLNLNAIEADQIFEVPQDMFQVMDQQNIKKKNKKENKKIIKKNIQQKLQMEAIQEQNPQKDQDQEENYGNQNQYMDIEDQNDEHLSRKQKKYQISSYQPLNQQEEAFINPIKRKIFFISATLTKQFKGTKYFQKKKFQEVKQQKGKSKNNKFSKDNKNKDKNGKDKQQTDDGFIPKLKALMSVVKFNSKPKVIDLSSQIFLPDKLNEKVCFCDDDLQKISLVICYLMEIDKKSKVIIFANTIKCSKRVQFFVQSFGFKTLTLHSHMQEKQRITKLQRFKNSETGCIMIATDVAARGLDFFISNVIQYNIPINGDTYVHRIGRTARANRNGQSLTMIEKKQASRWNEINDAIGQRKLDKYLPEQKHLNEISQKINNLQWIRRNKQQLQDDSMKKRIKKDADELGVQYQEQRIIPKQNRIDNQQQVIKKSMIKKQIAQLKRQNNQMKKDNNEIKWRKNKMVVSFEDIKKYL